MRWRNPECYPPVRLLASEVPHTIEFNFIYRHPFYASTTIRALRTSMDCRCWRLRNCCSLFLCSPIFYCLRKKKPEMERPFRAAKSPIFDYLALVLSLRFIILYFPGMPASLIWPYKWIMVAGWTLLGGLFLHSDVSWNVSEENEFFCGKGFIEIKK